MGGSHGGQVYVEQASKGGYAIVAVYPYVCDAHVPSEK